MVVVVVGAGMVGCATALSLQKRGHKVVVFERRSDPRLKTLPEAGRSINLALSARGTESLQTLGDPVLTAAIEAELMPMRGRMLHSKLGGEMTPVSYGISGTEAINSIGRTALNNLLLDACTRADIDIRFDTEGPTSLTAFEKFGASTVFGCDGTFSKMRNIIARETDSKLEIETVSTYYVEIPMPMAPQWSKEHLHIWPRGTHMLIALPNPAQTFTGTLFAPKEVFDQFDVLRPDLFVEWFVTEFPDAASVIGIGSLKYIAETGNWGKLTNVKFAPYNLDSRMVLLGDAAHSMVPFYGQGLNTGLEDVRILFEKFIDQYPTRDLKSAFDAYTAYRKPDCDAIVNLSIANYEEMRSSVATLSFRVRKLLDNFLAQRLGDYWLPLYTMVSFRSDIRYSQALRTSQWQRRFLDRLIKVAGVSVVVLILLLSKLRSGRNKKRGL